MTHSDSVKLCGCDFAVLSAWSGVAAMHPLVPAWVTALQMGRIPICSDPLWRHLLCLVQTQLLKLNKHPTFRVGP